MALDTALQTQCLIPERNSISKLYHRLSFQSTLDEMLKQVSNADEKKVLFVLDIDHFSQINERIGYENGNRLLAQVAQRLCEIAPDNALPGHFDSDRFALFVHSLSINMNHFSKMLLSSFSEPFILDEKPIHLTASIGCAVAPDHGKVAHELIKSAQSAMKEVKERGRSSYAVFRDPLDAKEHARKMKVWELLHEAYEQKQFHLQYQPKISYSTNKVVGAEALIRWNNKELGLVLPDEFIHIAEQSGIIVTLGDWIIEESCRELKRWQEAGFTDLVMSVNVSARQLVGKNLAGDVMALLHKTNVPPHQLELELTESLMMHDIEQISAMCHALSLMGVKLAIDDFGTGYSCLSHLASLPFNTMKIDRSFVKEMLNKAEIQAIIGAIIDIGKSLKMELVAEGVENILEVEQLVSMGCDVFQGYYYSKSLPSDEMLAFLKEHNTK